ncbi:DUF397 domain-containing protein [Streptomyces sp. 6N223]|uniref:DUF397 domain-containing protein n=1 Tax=Streptomyces sp. 6N223 TaxID=3457412 RepID=UPI003FD3FC6B
MRSKSIPDASALRAAWRKSSYSHGDNGDCLEVAEVPGWRKSSYSLGDNGDCLEVADGVPGVIPVRDSKNPHGPALAIPAAGWSGFVAAVKGGRFGR